MVFNQFDRRIKSIKSDNEGEFFSTSMSNFFDFRCILHYSSFPPTPQQNEVVERKHRHILNVVRSLQMQSDIPLKFWGHYISHSIFIINRLPSKANTNVSPYELLYARTPNYYHLKAFRCLCYAPSLVKENKFAPKAKKKGYLLYDLQSHNFLVNRDVVFCEDTFPFKLHYSSTKDNSPMSSSAPRTHHPQPPLHEESTNMPPTSSLNDPRHSPNQLLCLLHTPLEGTHLNLLPPHNTPHKPTPILLKRSNRVSRPPVIYKDFHCYYKSFATNKGKSKGTS